MLPMLCCRRCKAGVNLQHVTFSSDANASLPMFDAQNNFVGLGEGRIASLYEEMTDAIRLGVPVQDALRVVTSNPARILKAATERPVAAWR